MIRYYLDKKKNDLSPILLSFHHKGKRLRMFVGKSIDPDQWDYKEGRVNPRKYKNNAQDFNRLLQKIRDEVESTINGQVEVTKEILKTIIYNASASKTINFGAIEAIKEKEEARTFHEFSTSHLQTQIAKGTMKRNSSKAYRVTLNHLRAVNPSLKFNDVNLQFYDAFISYLKQEGLNQNSIGGHIKRLKWFMNAGLERDLHQNLSHKKRSFAIIEEETDSIYLSRQEINKLKSEKLQGRLRRIADTFIMNCSLGMRFSDLVWIRRESFKLENGLLYLSMVQSKTQEKVRIPVDPDIFDLLKHYEFSCPAVRKGRLMSVQKFNDYIKDAAKLSGIEEMVEVRKGSSIEVMPKYDLISSHTARRSFCTNLYLDGIPIQNIMAISGHKKEETFRLYIRADQFTKAEGLAQYYRQRSNKNDLQLVTQYGSSE